MNKELNKIYIDILKEELVLALGCTEPSAVAYCAAKVKETLGGFPEKINVSCSGNIVKNVKGVIVPNSGGLRGIAPAAILGCFTKDASNSLEVLNQLNKDDIVKAKEIVNTDFCTCTLKEGESNLYINITGILGNNTAQVIIRDGHTNIVLIEFNDEVIYKKDEVTSLKKKENARNKLNIKDIINFANTVEISQEIQTILDPQIKSNFAIGEEGLKSNYGANVGKTILETREKTTTNIAIAKTAAGSDARMSGSIMPVVINSGSGNQGIVVTVPVVEFANSINSTKENLYRALLVSNLIAIHIKTNIGKLSAFCGAISAAAAAAGAICYLNDCTLKEISDTVVTTLCNVGGVVCDGAKASCAAKIATALDASFLSMEMAKKNRTFSPGEGLVTDNPERTIKYIGQMGKEGMKETDTEILKIMLEI